MQNMAPYKAIVRNGRLVLDEPTDRPEGEVVNLEEADPYAYLDHEEDELDDEERAKLHASIERGLEDMRAGRSRDIDEVIAELRQRR